MARSLENLIALVDRFIGQPERDWLEFKEGLTDAATLGKHLSAVANSACLRQQDFGYVLIGIRDTDRAIVGTHLDPDHHRAKGAQLLPIFLSTQLQPNPGLDIFPVEHAHGRVIVFRMRRAAGQPVKFAGTAWVKVGTSTTHLDSRTDLLRTILNSETDWSGEVSPDATIRDLDARAVQRAREEYKAKFPAKADQVDEWGDIDFLNKAKVTKQGRITNTALILLGTPEATAHLAPAVANIMWIVKDERGMERGGRPFQPPFILASDELFASIQNIPIRELAPGTLFPREIQPYDRWVVREALHNCIAHQDYAAKARIQVVETPDSLTFTNAGHFLPPSVEEVIRQDAPWDVYRNRWLADAMFNLNMIETQGGGIKRMFSEQAKRYMPMPTYDLTKENRVFLTIQGKVLDERYTRMLMHRTDLPLDQIMLLDRVQRGLKISADDHRRLKANGLVEGRYPQLFVSGHLARLSGEETQHIRNKGLEYAKIKEFIVRIIEQHPGVGRKKIDELAMDLLPALLDGTAKRRRIHYLIQQLVQEGRIHNKGSRGPSSSWHPGPISLSGKPSNRQTQP